MRVIANPPEKSTSNDADSWSTSSRRLRKSAPGSPTTSTTIRCRRWSR